MKVNTPTHNQQNGLLLESFEVGSVARLLIKKVFTTVNGKPGLLNVGGSLWVYEEDQWQEIDRDGLLDRVMIALEDARHEVQIKANEKTIRRWSGEKNGSFVRRCGEVVRFVMTLTQRSGLDMPCWTEGGEGMPAEKCVAFLEHVVCVHGGVRTVVNRDETWFSPEVVPYSYDPDATCPLWNKCLMDWMPHDEGGRELMRRWFGYLLMSHRGYERGLLQLGKVRSGKGTSTDVARRLLGKRRYHGRTLEDLCGSWALEDLHTGGVMVVSEVNELSKMESQRVTKNVKHCIGQDVVSVNGKYKAKIQDVKLKVAPWICGNEMPGLSNRGQGLGGKILPIKFNVSFLGKEDVDLGAKLSSEREMSGIAIWALEGALALEASEAKDRWPDSIEGKEVMDEFFRGENELQMFLESQFVEAPGKFVQNSLLKGLWVQWCKTEGVKSHVSTLHLPKKLKDEASWNLEARKKSGMRGLVGLALKKGASRGVKDRSL